MKKISRKIFGLLAASALFAGAFVSCSNGSDSPSATGSGSGSNPASSGQTTTVSAVDSVATTGTAEVSGTTATLTASNGKYVLKAGQGTHNNIAANGASTTTSKGTWKFIENGKEIAKYVGSYIGNISTIGSSDTDLSFKVEKVLNTNGFLTAVVEVKSFKISFTSTSKTFSAEIPAVKVSSVTTYVASKEYVKFDSADSYEISSTFKRIDLLADGKLNYQIVGSTKSKKDGKEDNKPDNSYMSGNGTYTIDNGEITFSIDYNNTKITEKNKINYDGDLKDNKGETQYNQTSASGKLYVNALTVLDGANSYAHNRTIGLYDDSGKTGVFIDIKRVPNKSKDFKQRDITYEISGKTVKLTGNGQTKTATLSDDGKKLTLDGVEYLKM